MKKISEYQMKVRIRRMQKTIAKMDRQKDVRYITYTAPDQVTVFFTSGQIFRAKGPLVKEALDGRFN